MRLENFITGVSKQEKENQFIDEHRAAYSADMKRLLYVPKQLTSYVIKEGTECICDCAFDSCKKITNVQIPDSVKLIGKMAFADCCSLENIQLPKKVVFLGEKSFFGCRKLVEIRIPASVKAIGFGAFEECTSLERIDVDEKNRFYCSIDGVLLSKDGALLIRYPQGKASDGAYRIPKSVKRLAMWSFCSCPKLHSVSISDSVHTIGEGAFMDSALQEIILPESVNYIDDRAFHSSKKLRMIDIPSSVLYIGSSSFIRCRNLSMVKFAGEVDYLDVYAFDHKVGPKVISIPKGSESAFKKAVPGNTLLKERA